MKCSECGTVDIPRPGLKSSHWPRITQQKVSKKKDEPIFMSTKAPSVVLFILTPSDTNLSQVRKWIFKKLN